MSYEVRIIEKITGEVVDKVRIDRGGVRAAQRVQRGVEINLNHNLYRTAIGKEEKK